MPKTTTPAKTKALIMKYFVKNEDTISKLTTKQIRDIIKKDFDTTVSNQTIIRWLDLADIEFKRKLVKVNIDHNSVIKNTKRIRMLAILFKNLCKEFDVKVPQSNLDLIECIEKELEGGTLNV